jgi:hypothetical protein
MLAFEPDSVPIQLKMLLLFYALGCRKCAAAPHLSASSASPQHPAYERKYDENNGNPEQQPGALGRNSGHTTEAQKLGSEKYVGPESLVPKPKRGR